MLKSINLEQYKNVCFLDRTRTRHSLLLFLMLKYNVGKINENITVMSKPEMTLENQNVWCGTRCVMAQRSEQW